MTEQKDINNNSSAIHSSICKIDVHNGLQPSNGEENLIRSNHTETLLLKSAVAPTLKNISPLLFKTNLDKIPAPAVNPLCKNLFRFFVKNGEHVYGRANDIIVIESCDHLVNVYLAYCDKIKKTIRTNTLKDFLSLLPADQFVRISRFCAINVLRLSGGNCRDQTFEFDFRFSVKLKHAVPNAIFNCIGK